MEALSWFLMQGVERRKPNGNHRHRWRHGVATEPSETSSKMSEGFAVTAWAQGNENKQEVTLCMCMPLPSVQCVCWPPHSTFAFPGRTTVDFGTI